MLLDTPFYRFSAIFRARRPEVDGYQGYQQKSGAGFPGRFFEKIVGLVPAATTVATVSATTLATVSTASAAAATATISAATATTTTAAAFTRFHRTRFVDREGATVDFLAVEFRDGRLSFLGCAHFHETKAAGTTRHAIIDHLDPRDIARLGKEIGEVVFRHAEGQVAHIEFHAHF
jgi:hypothetical protein